MRSAVGYARIVVLILALLLIGAAPGAHREAPTSVPIAATVPVVGPGTVVPLRVMPLGASSTEGLGSPATAGYRAPLFALLRRDGIAADFVGSLRSGPASLPDRDNEGHSGWTITMLTPRVAGWVRAARPDVILLHAGTNDLGAGASGAVVAQRLDDLLNRVYRQAPAVHVVVAGVWATMRSRAAARADLATRTPGVVTRHRALGHSITFVDTSDLLPASEFADGLHPNAAGYARIARMFEREIGAYLAGRRAAPTA